MALTDLDFIPHEAILTFSIRENNWPDRVIPDRLWTGIYDVKVIGTDNRGVTYWTITDAAGDKYDITVACGEHVVMF